MSSTAKGEGRRGVSQRQDELIEVAEERMRRRRGGRGERDILSVDRVGQGKGRGNGEGSTVKVNGNRTSRTVRSSLACVSLLAWGVRGDLRWVVSVCGRDERVGESERSGREVWAVTD